MPKPPIEPRVLHSVEPLRYREPQKRIWDVVLLYFSTVRGDKYLEIVSVDKMSVKGHRRAPAWNRWVVTQVKNANPFVAPHIQVPTTNIVGVIAASGV